MHEYSRSIALLSDMHVGSRFGLCPKDYVTDTENPISMSPGQQELLNAWESYWRTMDEMQVDTIFLIGDIMAGANFKEGGCYMMTTDMNEQVQMASMLLAPHVAGRKLLVWSGTPYHEARDYRIHESLAEKLNASFMGEMANVQVLPSEKIVHVRHASTNALVYPETMLGRDIMFLKEAEALSQVPKICGIITGHRHSYIEIHKYDVHYISLPCWEAFTPYYKASINYFKYQPDIGGALMLLDIENRFRFMHFLYPCPRISDAVVKG